MCLTCTNEAEQNKGVIPIKVKQFIAFSHDEGMISTKADTNEGKILRNQISAFAYYHTLNRWEAVERIKKIGALADVIMPYMLPAEKDAPKPDYYLLKVHDWPDLSVLLNVSEQWNCQCEYCHTHKNKYQKWFSKGLNYKHLSVPVITALLPEEQPTESTEKDEYLQALATKIEEHNPVQSAGPKDVECLLTSQEFNTQLAAFAGAHGLNRHTSYSLLPDSWKTHFPHHYSEAGPPVPKKEWYNESEGVFQQYGQFAVATQCKCGVCKSTIQSTPKKEKMALTKKKVTKKTLMEQEAVIEQAMGKGLTEDFSFTNMPLNKQVLAYAAYHEKDPYQVWQDQECCEGVKNPFGPYDYEGECPEVSDLEFHIWPDLGSCGCSECQNQPTPPEEEEKAPKPAFAVGGTIAPGYIVLPKTMGKMKFAASTMSKLNDLNSKKVPLSAGQQVVVSAPNGGDVTVPEDAVYTVIPGTAIKTLA